MAPKMFTDSEHDSTRPGRVLVGMEEFNSSYFPAMHLNCKNDLKGARPWNPRKRKDHTAIRSGHGNTALYGTMVNLQQAA